MNRVGACPGTERGVALALLLWMLAGLALLVAGIQSLARSDVQLTGLQLDQARAEAVATGVAHAALRDLWAMNQAGASGVSGILQGRYELGGLEARVSIVPAAGLVNINSATPELLARLFQAAAGMSEQEAGALAAAIVDWRSGTPEDGAALPLIDEGRGPFRVEEELLEVPGVTRDLYEAIRRHVHTLPGAEGGLDLRLAPEYLLNAWRAVEPDAVDFALKSRQDDARNEAPAGPNLPPGLAGPGVYCLDIDVSVTEGRRFRQRIWVEMAGGAGELPWRFSRVHPPFLLPATSHEAQFAI